jgi:hypothetical protein
MVQGGIRVIKKVVMVLAILALVASAGTVPAGHYRFTLDRPAIVKGTVLKAGDYRLALGDAKVVITDSYGHKPIEVPVKIESVEKKFGETVIGYNTENGKDSIREIRLGGTTTKVVFNP